MAEEITEKTNDDKRSSIGERMSDIEGMKVYRDGKWIRLSDITKKQETEVKTPVRAAVESDDNCPPATQDIAINLANREKAIKTAEYGPLNPKEPNDDFWASKAQRWNVSSDEARKSVCGNCVMFIRTPKMLDCIEGGLAAGDSGEQNAWDAIDTAELGYCEAFDFKCAASRTCNAWVVGGPITKEKEEAVTATAGSKPAPKKDQIKGSDKNSEGSASGSKSITFSKKVEESLKSKVEEFNKTSNRKASLSMVKAVYRRGAGAFSSSHRPDQNRNSWAMARVNAFLHLLKSGSPKNSKYTTDNDLLPPSHPKSSKKSVRASGDQPTLTPEDQTTVYEYDYSGELTVTLLSETEYTNKEQAIFALAEYSDASYEIIPALKAAWLRAETMGENPFNRAKRLAVYLDDSQDADLLPKEI